MQDKDARQIAAQAWAQVKEAADPDYARCAEDHKCRLAYKVQSVLDSGALEDDFDRHVWAILHPEQAELVIGKQVVVAEPEQAPVPDAVPTAELPQVAEVVTEAAPKRTKTRTGK